MQGSFATVRVLFSPFDGSKILLPFAQKTFGFYKLSFGQSYSLRKTAGKSVTDSRYAYVT